MTTNRTHRGRGRTDEARGGSDDPRRSPPRSGTDLTRAQARAILDVGLTADDDEVRAAYRTRIKDVHPDNGGDKAAFLRVRAAYDRLSE
ncbi:DnaJ domain-containing protein [Natronolimnohabitans innermongolicus]|uniref:Heat shock protein DnaJ domain protein n=1 Tax=Natronolimnohabitans innermongolicus JCM 12255 TaxID=1227499 RepID=L9X724_9EURY|nr:DnaJ domain-containing protein [Natronolimnohabitans innermongolicus]ELY57574.1 heat shock protein DnaJ domain protein [Natronolimnohabitans innermongolicus JCM 12255]